MSRKIIRKLFTLSWDDITTCKQEEILKALELPLNYRHGIDNAESMNESPIFAYQSDKFVPLSVRTKAWLGELDNIDNFICLECHSDQYYDYDDEVTCVHCDKTYKKE